MFELSPEIEVRWCGMRGNTRTMQMAGWEFAVQQEFVGVHVGVIAKHKVTGVMLRGQVDTDTLMQAHFDRMGASLVMQEVSFTGPEKQLVIYGAIPEFGRVDMLPSFSNRPARHPFDVFTPWAPDAEEIIVDPPTVASLLDQIRSLQEPELAEIRKRNKLREYQASNGREVVRAQILTMAA